MLQKIFIQLFLPVERKAAEGEFAHKGGEIPFIGARCAAVRLPAR